MTKKIAPIALWGVTILLTLLFVSSAAPKLQAAPGMVRRFADWGYGPGFLVLIGVLEAAGGVALLIPRVAFYGACTLFAVMLGAVYTHLSTGVGSPLFALLAAILLAVVAWRRRPPGFLRPGAIPAQDESSDGDA